MNAMFVNITMAGQFKSWDTLEKRNEVHLIAKKECLLILAHTGTDYSAFVTPTVAAALHQRAARGEPGCRSI